MKERTPDVRYSEAIAAAIVARLSGGETLRAITRSAGMPHWRTVYRWMSKRQGFKTRIAGAREIGYDAIADECLAIADTPEIGVIETVTTGGKSPGREVRKGDMTEHRKLKIWTRLQLLAKWCPKKYGERTAIDMNVKSDLADRLAAGRKRVAK